MTTPNGNVIFNANTGSDSLASGLGPATAVYGSSASIASASAVVTGISTTGVTAGDLLWVQSSTGRQFSIIASVDSSTQVTCDNNFEVTETGRNWAIGGKRATLDNVDSQRLFTTTDGSFAFWAELETDQTVASPLGAYTVTSKIRSSDNSHRTITFDSSSLSPPSNFFIRSSTVLLHKIKIICLDPTGVVFQGRFSGGTNVRMFDCIIGDPSYPTDIISNNERQFVSIKAYNSLFQNIKHPTYGYMHTDSVYFAADQCMFKDCGSLQNPFGLAISSYGGDTSSYNKGHFNNCVFLGDGTTPLCEGRLPEFNNCIVSNYTHAVTITSDGAVYSALSTYGKIKNCVLHNMTSVVNLDPSTLDVAHELFVADNYLYNVGSFSNVSSLENYVGQDNTTLTTDPLQIQNGNVQLTNSAGGGYTVRNAEIKL